MFECDGFPFVCFCSDDMMENDCESLRERVGVLEKKVFDQNDEIVCLRSTLADVLRRLDQMEHLRSIVL